MLFLMAVSIAPDRDPVAINSLASFKKDDGHQSDWRRYFLDAEAKRVGVAASRGEIISLSFCIVQTLSGC